MRNAEYKGRVESRNETRAAIPHSAFRTPHSVHSAFRIPHLGGVVKVLIAGGGTGGHLMPALALAQALRDAGRSEEHTSELQSRLHLVCRLLLEKKKKRK